MHTLSYFYVIIFIAYLRINKTLVDQVFKLLSALLLLSFDIQQLTQSITKM